MVGALAVAVLVVVLVLQALSGSEPLPTPTVAPSVAPEPPPGAVEPPDRSLPRAAGAVVALLLLGGCGLVAVLVLRARRRRSVQLVPAPSSLTTPAGGAARRPQASLGTPDVLVLDAATTEDDRRLRDHLARQSDAFVSVQLACSFDPTAEWTFTGARLSVRLARGDGEPAPAPIAYSLRPLTERDGSAREQTAELGADAKLVTAKVGLRRTSPGDLVVRGYGLQQSLSYWQFTPTKADPLRGSYWLWLIVKAPKETHLVIVCSLEAEVTPSQWWHSGGRPCVEGTGEVGVVVRLAGGEPYRVEELRA